MPTSLPYSLPVNTWLGTLTSLLLYTKVANGFTGSSTNKLLNLCLSDPVSHGKGRVIPSADWIEPRDLTLNSTLLQVNPPTVSEQILEVDTYKTIPLSIFKWYLQESFESDDASAMFTGYLLSIMESSKNIFLYEQLVDKLKTWVPEEASQTVTIDQYKSTGVKTADLIKVAQFNAQSMAVAIHNLKENMVAPTRLYNDQAYKQLIGDDDLVLILTGNFESQALVYALGTLFHDDKANDVVPVITIPSDMIPDTAADTVGWLIHREKLVYGYFFNVATAFFDSSNLNDNHWLHFSYYMGFVDAYPGVRLKAAFVDPVV